MFVSRRMVTMMLLAPVAAKASDDDDRRFLSGNHDVDMGVEPTLDFLAKLFGVDGPWLPDFAFFDDGSTGNASASIPLIGATGPLTRPIIKIGRTLVDSIVKKADGNYGAGLTGVFAHEFAHVYQMKAGYRQSLLDLDGASSTRLLECHADFLAGWALPQAFWITKVADLGLAAKQFYQLGDIEFEALAHHGTGLQRQSIMASGYTWGLISPGDADSAADRGVAVLKDLFPQWIRSS